MERLLGAARCGFCQELLVDGISEDLQGDRDETSKEPDVNKSLFSRRL
jgi:hypothetical protein